MDRRRQSYASIVGGASSSATPPPTNRTGQLAHVMNPSPSTPSHSQPQDPDPRPQSSQHQSYTDEITKSIPQSLGRANSSQNNWNHGGPPGGYNGPGLGSNMLLRPSYLRGSKYLEELEVAYKVKHANQRDLLTPGQHGSGQASLSTSSSSVSLHRMAPSHRGMTYEIVEHQPPAENDGIPPLPSKWAEVDRLGGLEVSPDGQDIRYSGTLKSQEHEAAAARTDHPMPPQCGVYYYEVSLVSKGKEGMIGIGFSGSKASLEKLPGWEPESWAFHGDDGKSFCCQHTGKSYGPTFTVGDVVGCGVNFRSGTAFFTKNGLFLGNAFKDIKDIKLYPSIGMKRPGVHIKVNFGQSPFMFDIDEMMRNEKRSVRNDILKADLGKLSPPLRDAELKRDLIAQFLRHDGYVSTARSFAEEVKDEVVYLKKKMQPQVDDSSAQHDADAIYRQQIRAAILEGEINRALKLTDTYYPDVLQENPRILFRLRCRKFVEMMRFTSTPAPTRKASSKSLNAKIPTITTTDDVFEQEMELDEMNGGGDDWDRMETEEVDGRYGTFEDRIEQALKYAQELKQDYKDDKTKEVASSLQEIFALFAYEDPRNSPTAHVLDASGRVPVAEELNSAILISLGKSSSAAIERVCQQTEVLVSEISDHAGPGAFINVQGDLLR